MILESLAMFIGWERVGELAEQAIADNACTALVAGIVSDVGVVHSGAWGTVNPESKIPVTTSSLFDIASLTKPIVTATSLLILVEGGYVTLDDKLTKWFPDCKHLHGITLKHLATHTSGLPPFKLFYKDSNDKNEIIAAASKTALDYLPGKAYIYSDIGYMLLGAVIEKVSSHPLDKFAKENIFDLLGMKSTGFNPQGNKENIVVTGNCSYRPGETLQGQVHDPNAAAMGGVAGHAGLFSSFDDLAKLNKLLLGEDEKYDILSARAHDLYAMSQNDFSLPGHSIGWFAYENNMTPTGDLLGPMIWGHTGFTGVMITIDKNNERDIFIILSNRVYSDPTGERYIPSRKKILNVMASIYRSR